ncbi:MAG: Hpt domain-containing protein, partial [Parvibaculum sp.]
MTEDDIQQIFFVECEEALEAAETGLDACRAGTHDSETINAIFRAVHSIKGGAGAFGYLAMQAFTHSFETLLADIREGKLDLTAELVDLLLLALDCLRDHVEAAREGSQPPEDCELLGRLEAALQGPSSAEAPPAVQPSLAPLDDLDALLNELSAPPSAEPAVTPAEPSQAEWRVHVRPHAGAMANGTEPVLWLRELSLLGGRCEACDLTALPHLDR